LIKNSSGGLLMDTVEERIEEEQKSEQLKKNKMG